MRNQGNGVSEVIVGRKKESTQAENPESRNVELSSPLNASVVLDSHGPPLAG